MSSLGYKQNTNVLVYKSLKERAFWQQKQLDDITPVLYKTLIYRCVRNGINTFSNSNNFADCKLCNENSLTPFSESKFSIFNYLEDINSDKSNYTFLLEIDNINSVSSINPDSYIADDYKTFGNIYCWSQYSNPIKAFGFKEPQIGIVDVHKRTKLFKNLFGLAPLTISEATPSMNFLDFSSNWTNDELFYGENKKCYGIAPLTTDKVIYKSAVSDDLTLLEYTNFYCTEQLYLVHHNGSYKRPGITNDTITQEITHTRNLNKI